MLAILLLGVISFGVVSASDLNSTDLESATVYANLSEISNENNLAVFESENSNNLSNNTLSKDDGTKIQKSTSLIISNTTYFTGCEFTVTLKDSNGNGVSNQSVNIIIGNASYNKTTNSNGIVNINITQNPGSYQTTINYNGNDNYTSSNTSATINILKTIQSSDLKIYYKSATKYSATFLNSQGNVLANTYVQLTLNGKSYTVKTNAKGVASLLINLKPGTYSVIAYNPYTGYSVKNTVWVLSTIHANSISKIYGDARKFTAKFYKSNGEVLAKKTVKFKIKGKIYKVKTNSKGVASLKLTKLKKGSYKIISYNLDGLTLIKKVKVYNKTPSKLKTDYYIFLKNDRKIIKVKLLNKMSYSPGKGKIIKMKINKKTYSKKTNSQGVAAFKLPRLSKGTYLVRYHFAGDKHYYKSSATNKVVIIPSKSSTLTFKSTSIFGQGAGTPLKVVLTASGIKIAKRSVTINLNGINYTKTTDSKGVASLKIGNVEIGKYTVYYSFNGDEKLHSASGSKLISVKERIPTTTTYKSKTSCYVGLKNLKVLLTDKNSKALSGKSVKLTLNSKTYIAKTSQNGYATFSLKLSAGIKRITTTFSGDNDYLGSLSTAEITVKSKFSAIPLNNILSTAKSLKSYYGSHKKLPSTVSIKGVKYTTSEFLYLMSHAIVNLGKSKTNNIKAISVSNPTYSTGDTINSKSLSKSNYLSVANNVLNYIKSTKDAPNYMRSPLGKIAYEELVDSFSRILDTYNTNKNLPSSVTIKYLEADTVSELASKLTAGLTTEKEKANILFIWVRDNIDYSFYYNTIKGASKTLSSGTGNCCDQAQLLVALACSAGLTARFATGYCKFSSGSWYGHVWVQVKISDSWHPLDTTSSRNTYSSINNWNTASYSNRGIYTILPY